MIYAVMEKFMDGGHSVQIFRGLVLLIGKSNIQYLHDLANFIHNLFLFPNIFYEGTHLNFLMSHPFMFLESLSKVDIFFPKKVHFLSIVEQNKMVKTAVHVDSVIDCDFILVIVTELMTHVN